MFVKSNLWDARGDGAVDSRRKEVCFPFRTHVENRDRHVDDEDAIPSFCPFNSGPWSSEFRMQIMQ